MRTKNNAIFLYFNVNSIDKLTPNNTDIKRLKDAIDHEISLDADKRDNNLLESLINEYLRATNVNIEELEVAATRCTDRILSEIRKQDTFD